MYEAGCTNSRTTDCHCFPDLEFLSVVCRPFSLPRELSVVTVTTVYIHSHISIVLSLLLANVNKQQRTYPDGVHILASDFN